MEKEFGKWSAAKKKAIDPPARKLAIDPPARKLHSDVNAW